MLLYDARSLVIRVEVNKVSEPYKWETMLGDAFNIECVCFVLSNSFWTHLTKFLKNWLFSLLFNWLLIDISDWLIEKLLSLNHYCKINLYFIYLYLLLQDNMRVRIT